MSETSKLIETIDTYSAHNYHPLPVVLRSGGGSRVKDVEGKEYLDFLACYSALNFGHQNPRIVATLLEQVGKLAVCSRAFHSEEFGLFCKELSEFCGLDMALAMNSGTEAVETAIKLSRKWGYQKKKVAPNRANIIVMENNFHGRSVTIVSFSSEPLYRDDFGPFTPGFRPVPFADPQAIESAIDANTVAVILEPIQAEAGILIPPAGYLKEVETICRKHNVLLAIDEIQTGLGRTGKDFCYQHDGVQPDLLILGKSLGGGLLPLSAVVGRRDVMEVVKPGEHGSTFGGNPLASALGRTALKILKEEKLSERALDLGAKAKKFFTDHPSPIVEEVRGQGLLLGVELKKSTGGARKYCEAAAKEGVLCKETHDYVIRIAPPLTITEADLMEGCRKILSVISKG